MRHLYWAMSEATRFDRFGVTEDDRPSGWRAWLAGVAFMSGVACWAMASVLYGLFHVHAVGALLAAVAVCTWEHWLHEPKFPGGAMILAHVLQPKSDTLVLDQHRRAAVNLGLLLLKPLLVMLLCSMKEMRWLIAYSVLSSCIMLDLSGAVLVRRKTCSWKAVSHWIVAAVVLLILSLLHGVHFTLVAIAALAAAFLLPPIAVRFSPFEAYDRQPSAKALYLCFGELTMLLVGVIGLAF